MTVERESEETLGPVASLVLAVGPVIVASVLGQFATIPNLSTWYADLDKPGFTPPDWVFAPAWTTLYALMAAAAWRLLHLPRGTAGKGLALGLLYAQLVLNMAWSWMFFDARSPMLGLVNIVPQWLVILAAILAAWRVDRVAAGLLVPLLVWVGYAAALNFEIWRLNG